MVVYGVVWETIFRAPNESELWKISILDELALFLNKRKILTCLVGFCTRQLAQVGPGSRGLQIGVMCAIKV